jgi:hypothetical protein
MTRQIPHPHATGPAGLPASEHLNRATGRGRMDTGGNSGRASRAADIVPMRTSVTLDWTCHG